MSPNDLNPSTPLEEESKMDEGWWTSVLSEETKILEKVEGASTDVGTEEAEVPDVDWEYVQSLYENDEIISLEVTGYNRGGLLVQAENIQGFVPISHLIEMPGASSEEDRKNRLNDYIGKSIELKVIECEPAMERIVFSERAAQAGKGKRKELFGSLGAGAIASGIVTNVTDFGAFIDLGGVEGLIHVSELSWGRVQHPNDVVRVGQKVETLVLQVCEQNSRVALSLKRLHTNPWYSLLDHYQPGDETTALITSITRFGAFARLPEGVEGLIHISSIELPDAEMSVEQVIQPGQTVAVQILHIDSERRRLGLGLVDINA
ncbi:MAG: 30S ribosomal protein S1 [Anaerolineaceae bacterium]|nr:30S ribosomal protein S1 [Anaerolineaceae bacterium]